VTVLVDDCRWWFKNRRWCHMVSDVDLDELHLHAAKLGIPRRVFQGDHYDVPEELRDEAIAIGAVPVPSRELVRRLRGAGLRLSPAARRGSAAAAPERLRISELGERRRVATGDDEPVE
jgi:hypothetical protein